MNPWLDAPSVPDDPDRESWLAGLLSEVESDLDEAIRLASGIEPGSPYCQAIDGTAVALRQAAADFREAVEAARWGRA